MFWEITFSSMKEAFLYQEVAYHSEIHYEKGKEDN